MLYLYTIRKTFGAIATATAAVALVLVLLVAYASKDSFRPIHLSPLRRAHPKPTSTESFPPLKAPANSSYHAPGPHIHERVIQVALVNAFHKNDDVQTALYNAISHVPNVNITRYQAQARFGMDYLVSNLPMAPSQPWNNVSSLADVFEKGMPVPDVVFSTTCGNDYNPYDQDDDVGTLKPIYRRLLEEHNTYLFCVMHESHHWIESYGWGLRSQFAPWVKARRIDFITMSPHVAEHFVHKVYSRWWWEAAGATKPRSHTLVPVFPVDLPKIVAPELETKGLKIAIEGEYHRGRNYAGAFARLVDMKRALYVKGREHEADDIEIHVFGHGLAKPVVPSDLKNQVTFHEQLDYQGYYSLLSQMDVILPAFSTTEMGGIDYYVNKASSTISTSLIAGVPLVANERLLKAYSYLENNVVWMSEREMRSNKGHNTAAVEVETAMKLLDLTPEDREAKKVEVAARRNKLLEDNYTNVKQWITDAHARIAFLESAAIQAAPKPQTFAQIPRPLVRA